jgi:hypothetical protein
MLPFLPTASRKLSLSGSWSVSFFVFFFVFFWGFLSDRFIAGKGVRCRPGRGRSEFGLRAL